MAGNLKIKQKLLLVLLPVPIAALILTGWIWYWNALQAAEETLKQQTSILVKNATLILQDSFEQRKSELQSVVKLKWIEDFFKNSVSRQVSQENDYRGRFQKLLVSLNGNFFQLTCFDPSGRPILKTLLTSFLPDDKLPAHVETEIFDSVDHMGFQPNALPEVKTILVSPVLNIRGFKAIVLSTSVYDANNTVKIGTMAFVLPISNLHKRITGQYSLAPDSQIMILDNSGQVLFHSDPKLINQKIQAAIPNLGNSLESILNNRSGSTDYQDQNKESWVFSYEHVPSLAWIAAAMSPVEPFIAPAKRAGLLGIVISVPIMFIVIYLIGYVSKRFVSDISEISDGARAIATGDLDRDLPVRSADEIGELADNFNKMRRDLKQMIKEVDLHKNLAAIGQFAAGMYHDLKSPLEGIKLLASGMQKKMKQDDPLKPYVDEIHLGVQNIDRLIYSTLDFVKPKSLALTEVNFNDLLRKTVDDIAVNGVKIEWRLSDIDHVVSLDSVQMKHVIINLINNSLEGMPDGGKIVIQSNLEGDVLTLNFTDTGIGIEPGDMDRLFDPFFTRKESGHGLGLSVVHQIIKNHKGSIAVSSRKGEGTTVEIRLPV